MNIEITVHNKIATVTTEDATIVCGNSDYTITFDLDEEWNGFKEKTARFIFGDNVIDIEFLGNVVSVPVITSNRELLLGIFAGDIASTYVRIKCRFSALCEDITGVEPNVITVPDNSKLNAKIEELTASNEALKANNEALKASIKPEQEKAVTITENGTSEILPDNKKTLSKVIVNVDVPASGDTSELESLIDESGVLDSTDGTATEKVEKLIDKAEDGNVFYIASGEWTSKFKDLFWNRKDVRKLPKLNYQKATTIASLASNSGIERVDYYVNSSQAKSAYQAFYNCKNLTFVYGVDLSNCTATYEMFKNCSLLETIQEPLNISNSKDDNTGFILGCPALKHIRFEECSIQSSIMISSSALLSDESLQSIIDGLAYSEINPSLTVHSNVYSRITDEQWTTAINKCWNIL